MFKKDWFNLFGGVTVILAVLLLSGIVWSTEDDYMDAYTGADADMIGDSTCIACHADRAAGDEETHVAIFDDEDNDNHGFGCEGCHGPGGNHMGDALGILQPAKMTQADVTDLCTQCHEENGAFELEAWGDAAHNAAGNSCVTCHSGHSENGHFLVEADVVDLCGSCHGDKIDEVDAGDHGAEDTSCEACHNPHA